ncbi:hypothetical protein H4R34_001309 [Dimargaris verticillata]|uniref:Chitinase n=1 Tax=Dimargaris verticillata TaxID=2761393 RepID=A0A9W8BB16_9FUNG|nr:hypothetical protein H4R34_001309 [Dimargaris verticillata]
MHSLHTLSLVAVWLLAAVSGKPVPASLPTASEGGICSAGTTVGCSTDGQLVGLCNQGKWVTYACPSGTSCHNQTCNWKTATVHAKGGSTPPAQRSNDLVAAAPGEQPAWQVASTPASSAAAAVASYDDGQYHEATVGTPSVPVINVFSNPEQYAESNQPPVQNGNAPLATSTAATPTEVWAAQPVTTANAAATAAASAPNTTPTLPVTGFAPSNGAKDPIPSSVSEAGAYPTESPSSSGGGGGGGGDSGNLMTCDEFTKAVTSSGYSAPSPAQCKAFQTQFSKADVSSKLEAAMLVAQLIWESGGFQYKSEIACQGTGCPGEYATPGVDAPGKHYFGRGYIQLTWAENYKAASQGLFGDDRLLKNPDLVASDEETAVGVGMHYWKTRVHTQPGVAEGKFGVTTNAINGKLECGGPNSATAAKRFEIYKKVLAAFQLNNTPDPSGC